MLEGGLVTGCIVTNNLNQNYSTAYGRGTPGVYLTGGRLRRTLVAT